MITPLLRRAAAVTTIVGALALVGCAGSTADAGPSAGPDASSADELTGELTIFAAASLSGAFDALSAEFEKQHPDVDVLPISYDGSSVLAKQLIEGASADVFASADEPNMAKVTDEGLAADAPAFATNTMQIAVAPGNPHKIESLEDLTDSALLTVLCAPEVPCGNASRTLLDAAGLTMAPASEEQNVTAVLTKVKSGEADAGLVYRTDIAAAGDEVEGIDVEGSEKATNVYPLTALADAQNTPAAQAFVEFVLSDAGQRVLADFGFGAP